MNKFDPNEVFINNFGRRIKNSGTKVDFDPFLTRCALLDNCFCSKNGDCGDKQICTTIGDYNYNVCKTKNEVPINLLPKFIMPNATGLFNFFTTQSGTLATALLSECTAETLLVALGDTSGNSLGAFIGGLASEVKQTAISMMDNDIFGIKHKVHGP